jgi:hypothetical protein
VLACTISLFTQTKHYSTLPETQPKPKIKSGIANFRRRSSLENLFFAPK